MPRPKVITDRFVRSLCARLAEGKRIRRSLPIWGRLHIDRPLPFLCVYRRPLAPDLAFEQLATSDASYLLASGDPRLQAGTGTSSPRNSSRPPPTATRASS